MLSVNSWNCAKLDPNLSNLLVIVKNRLKQVKFRLSIYILFWTQLIDLHKIKRLCRSPKFLKVHKWSSGTDVKWSHATCYRRYTICIYNCKRETNQSKSTLQIAVDIVEDFLLNLYDHPDVVELKTVTTLVNDRMNDKRYIIKGYALLM